MNFTTAPISNHITFPPHENTLTNLEPLIAKLNREKVQFGNNSPLKRPKAAQINYTPIVDPRS